MATKTIAIDVRTYAKLSRRKRAGESFGKTIERLVDADTDRGTCADAVREAAAVWGRPPSPNEVETMENVVRENRTRTDWTVELPR